MKMGVAKLQPRWGSTPVISVIKRSLSLLPAARYTPSSTWQLFSAYSHASTNTLQHPT